MNSMKIQILSIFLLLKSFDLACYPQSEVDTFSNHQFMSEVVSDYSSGPHPSVFRSHSIDFKKLQFAYDASVKLLEHFIKFLDPERINDFDVNLLVDDWKRANNELSVLIAEKTGSIAAVAKEFRALYDQFNKIIAKLATQPQRLHVSFDEIKCKFGWLGIDFFKELELYKKPTSNSVISKSAEERTPNLTFFDKVSIDEALNKVSFNKYFGNITISEIHKHYALDNPIIEKKLTLLLQMYVNEAIKAGKDPQNLFDGMLSPKILKMLQFTSLKENSVILSHPSIPDYIMKFHTVDRRLYGHYVLTKVMEKYGTFPLVLPKKYFVNIMLTDPTNASVPLSIPVLLAEKMALKDSMKIESALHFPPLAMGLIKVLQHAGYCDSHFGNVGLINTNTVTIIDTDLFYYFEPETICGATLPLLKNYYKEINPEHAVLHNKKLGNSFWLTDDEMKDFMAFFNLFMFVSSEVYDSL